MLRGLITVLLMLLLALVGCGPRSSGDVAPEAPDAAHTAIPTEAADGTSLELSSSAFGPGQPIPRTYTCDGEDVSPPLSWTDPPASTRSFALIADDPDAPGRVWVHWVLYNIAADIRSLPEGVRPGERLSGGGQQGRNSSRRSGYTGPCPPSGTHRYFFKLYALDTTLDVAAGAGKQELLRAMEGHILAEAELMGTYSR